MLETAAKEKAEKNDDVMQNIQVAENRLLASRKEVVQYQICYVV